MRNTSFLFLALIIFGCLSACHKKIAGFAESKALKVQQKNEASVQQGNEKLNNEKRVPLNDAFKSLLLPHQGNFIISSAASPAKERIDYSQRINDTEIAGAHPVSREIISWRSQQPVKEIVPEKKINYFTLFLLAAFFPPLAVGIKKSFKSWQFLLTLGLTLSFFVPGMVYAIVLMVREKNKEA